MRSYRRRAYQAYLSATYGEVNRLDDRAYRDQARFLTRLLGPYLPADRGAAILDIGCGVGYLLEMLAGAGYRNVEGIDISPEQVDAARRRGLPATQADVFEYLVGRREHYVLIVAFDIIEHLDRNELLRFLDLAREALRGGGRVVVRTANASSPLAARIRFVDLTHEQLFTWRSLRTAFCLCGLQPVAVFGQRPFPTTWKGHLREIAAQLGRRLWKAYLVAELGREAIDEVVEYDLIGVAERPAEPEP